MEGTGSTVAFAVGPDVAPELARLFDLPGPFVTVSLATDATLDNAGPRSQQRWRSVRDDLAAAGAPAAALEAIDALVPDAHHDGEGVVAVADAGGLRLVHPMDEAPARDEGRLASLPAVAPLIEWRQQNLAHIIVTADRSGADVTAVVPGREDVTDTAGSNNSGNPIIRKAHPGGWSQRRYQERAENTWEANAKAVAERVAQVAELISPRVILVAGDVRAVAFLKEHLYQKWGDLVRDLDGQRGADGGEDAIAEDARRQVQTVAASDTVAILEKFREEKGQQDRAADGPAATVEALNAAAVETLLVHDDPADERTLWFSAGSALVAPDLPGLEAYGAGDAREGRLPDVLIRQAFRTGARVRIVPATVVTDGAGAILRFTS